MNERALHEVLYISEKEMLQIADNQKVNGVPVYYSIGRDGRVTFWPPLDPKTTMLLLRIGDKKE